MKLKKGDLMKRFNADKILIVLAVIGLIVAFMIGLDRRDIDFNQIINNIHNIAGQAQQINDEVGLDDANNNNEVETDEQIRNDLIDRYKSMLNNDFDDTGLFRTEVLNENNELLVNLYPEGDLKDFMSDLMSNHDLDSSSLSDLKDAWQQITEQLVSLSNLNFDAFNNSATINIKSPLDESTIIYTARNGQVDDHFQQYLHN
jgi:hypothetical protein